MVKEVEQIGNLLKIDGEYFYPAYDDEDGKKHIIKFKHLRKEQYDKLVIELVKRLKDKVDIEDLLTQSLAFADIPTLRLAVRELEKGQEVKQERGCTELVIGKAHLQIGI